MKIHQNFIGGNIKVTDIKDGTVYLENELRDTQGHWFYWAFCIEGAKGKTLTFKFHKNMLGYWGPAVSYDLENFRWLEGECTDETFTYTFSESENKVYFFHAIPYFPKRFERFVKDKKLEISELCKGYKGSSVPCVCFGNGKTSIILTARHHACEATGNFVLEGVLEELIENPIADTKVFCVPFVDYEGVIRGDQGKSREPYDHNRDYYHDKPSIYPECAAIKEYAAKNGCHYGFDFHAPGHKGKYNDTIFIVRNRIDRLDRFDKFSALFEKAVTPDSMRYYASNDFPPETRWNTFGPQFACYMSELPENQLAFTLENAYFGTDDNKISEKGLIELGRCFAKALKAYMA